MSRHRMHMHMHMHMRLRFITQLNQPISFFDGVTVELTWRYTWASQVRPCSVRDIEPWTGPSSSQ